MAEGLKTPVLTMEEFTPSDHDTADRVAKFLGYEQTAYTSTSDLWGLFCMRENPAHASPRDLTPLTPGGHPIERRRNACIVKTREFGLMIVHTLEDIGLNARGRRDA